MNEQVAEDLALARQVPHLLVGAATVEERHVGGALGLGLLDQPGAHRHDLRRIERIGDARHAELVEVRLGLVEVRRQRRELEIGKRRGIVEHGHPATVTVVAGMVPVRSMAAPPAESKVQVRDGA